MQLRRRSTPYNLARSRFPGSVRGRLGFGQRLHPRRPPGVHQDQPRRYSSPASAAAAPISARRAPRSPIVPIRAPAPFCHGLVRRRIRPDRRWSAHRHAAQVSDGGRQEQRQVPREPDEERPEVPQRASATASSRRSTVETVARLQARRPHCRRAARTNDPKTSECRRPRRETRRSKPSLPSAPIRRRHRAEALRSGSSVDRGGRGDLRGRQLHQDLDRQSRPRRCERPPRLRVRAHAACAATAARISRAKSATARRRRACPGRLRCGRSASSPASARTCRARAWSSTPTPTSTTAGAARATTPASSKAAAT